MRHPLRVHRPSSRLWLSTALLGFAISGASAQMPSAWDYFDSDDALRKLENRFALVASDGGTGAAEDARALAASLAKYGWSVRLFGEARRAPEGDGWKQDWTDLSRTASATDTVLVAWVSAGPPPAELASWVTQLAALPAAHRVLFVDASRRALSESPSSDPANTAEPRWPDEVTVVLSAAWNTPSHAQAASAPSAEKSEALAHGLYLDAFLRAMGTKHGDLNGDRYVSLFEAHHAASARSARRAFDLGRSQRARIVSEAHGDVWIRDLRAPESKPPIAGSIAKQPAQSTSEPTWVIRVEEGLSLESDGERETLRVARRGALRWLLSAQAADGRWDADAFPFSGEKQQAGFGAGVHDVGVTGLALLALLGAEDDAEITAARRDAIDRGVRWLLTTPDAEGVLGGRKGHTFLYDHAIATNALCSALAQRDVIGLRDAAQRAVSTIVRARNPYKAWRYELPPNGENDSSISTWMTLALHAAKRAGLEIDAATKQGMISLLDELTDSATGRCGYTKRGEPPSRPSNRSATYPSANSESLTAGAFVVRRLLGETEEENPMLAAHLDLVRTKTPKASADGSTHDFIYWYFGARALASRDDAESKHWCEALALALLELQGGEGSAAPGSFDPNDPWGDTAGRIGSTAYAALALSELLKS